MIKYNNLQESELLTLIQQKSDHLAVEELLSRYKNLVRAIARRFYITTGDIEDLVQEGMITLYNAILSYNDSKIPLKSYLSICIERKMISMVRTAQGKKHSPMQNYLPLEESAQNMQNFTISSTPEDVILGEESFVELLQSMQKELSSFEYSILQLYIQGQSVLEIATQQKSNIKSVENALQRAKKKLRRLIASESSSIVSKI